MKSIFSAAFACSVFLGFCANLVAQPRESELERFGLVNHWEGNLGGADTLGGANSVLIWPHSTKNHEVVRVVVSGKLVRTFYGDQIDQTELATSIEAGSSGSKQPRLGMKGAQREAEKLAKKYSILGKKVDVQADEPVPVVYLVAVNQLGALSVLDAENGTLIWRNQLPDGTLPTFGPGASDEHVVVTNGKRLLVYEIATGRAVVDRLLEFVPTGQPTIANGKAVVPSVGGRTVFYDIKDAKIRSFALRIGTENRFGIAKSADRYLAWPVDSKLVIAQTEPETKLWTMFDARSKIHAKPIAVDNGFVSVSEGGNVVRCKNHRTEPLVWQTKLGSSCKQSPVAGEKIVTVVTDSNQLFALNLEDGTESWRSTGSVYVSVVAVTQSKVYAFDKSANLVIFDTSSGKIDGRVSMGLNKPIANSVSDRLFFAGLDGRIVSVREEGAKTPSFHFSNRGTSSDAVPAEEEKEAKADDASPAVDPFGNSELPMSETTTSDPFEIGKDPF
ncbi:MAG: PQQ-binding-like beta-propeller repeat protein [Planctomycetota bacterium]|nr:PQQ-binding-like beta-propeller repeat protein [Planctomycetota bacterium]